MCRREKTCVTAKGSLCDRDVTLRRCDWCDDPAWESRQTSLFLKLGLLPPTPSSYCILLDYKVHNRTRRFVLQASRCLSLSRKIIWFYWIIPVSNVASQIVNYVIHIVKSQRSQGKFFYTRIFSIIVSAFYSRTYFKIYSWFAANLQSSVN